MATARMSQFFSFSQNYPEYDERFTTQMENNKYRNVKIFASDFIYLFIDFCSNLKFRERLNEQNKQKRMKVYEKNRFLN